MDIKLWTAFVGGILSFLSPCVLPLVPPYLCYMAGISYEELRANGSEKRFKFDPKIIISAIGFILGFTIVFVLLGATASFIGRFLLRWQQEITMAAGVVIIIMGLHFLGVLRISLLLREVRFHAKNSKSGPIGAFVMGLAFAFGWTPCIGPILTPIISMAAKSDTVLTGAYMLAIYSLGLGIPFLFAAIFSGLFMAALASMRVHLGIVEKIIGVLLILAGIVFLTGKMQTVSNWFIDTFPFLLNLG